MTIDQLNDALIWLSSHQGTIRFRLGIADPHSRKQRPALLVDVATAYMDDEDDGSTSHAYSGQAAVRGGSVAQALVKAIQQARAAVPGRDADDDEPA